MSEKWQEDNRKEMPEIEITSSEEALKAPYYNRMDVVVVDFGDIKGDCLLRKRRPAIVLSRTEYNEHSPIMQVAPMKMYVKKTTYHVWKQAIALKKQEEHFSNQQLQTYKDDNKKIFMRAQKKAEVTFLCLF